MGLQGCALHLPNQRQRQRQRQKRASRGMAGWVRLRGTLQVRPCKLDRRLLVCAVLRTRQGPGWGGCPTRPRHASGPCGSRPRNRTHPAFDRFPLLLVGGDHATVGGWRPCDCWWVSTTLLLVGVDHAAVGGCRPWSTRRSTPCVDECRTRMETHFPAWRCAGVILGSRDLSERHGLLLVGVDHAAVGGCRPWSTRGSTPCVDECRAKMETHFPAWRCAGVIVGSCDLSKRHGLLLVGVERPRGCWGVSTMRLLVGVDLGRHVDPRHARMNARRNGNAPLLACNAGMACVGVRCMHDGHDSRATAAGGGSGRLRRGRRAVAGDAAPAVAAVLAALACGGCAPRAGAVLPAVAGQRTPLGVPR